MFIPFGFLGWIFPKFRNLKPLTFSFLSAIIIIETLQYFTRLGVFDVDDVISNTLGMWIGFKIQSSKFKIQELSKKSQEPSKKSQSQDNLEIWK
jgi:glycopeptide antibiotics resistance protein